MGFGNVNKTFLQIKIIVFLAGILKQDLIYLVESYPRYKFIALYDILKAFKKMFLLFIWRCQTNMVSDVHKMFYNTQMSHNSNNIKKMEYKYSYNLNKVIATANVPDWQYFLKRLVKNYVFYFLSLPMVLQKLCSIFPQLWYEWVDDCLSLTLAWAFVISCYIIYYFVHS